MRRRLTLRGLGSRGLSWVVIFLPKMSVRITETAESTNSHSTARKPSLMRVRVSSLMCSPLPRSHRLLAERHRDRGVAQAERRTVPQRGRGDAAAGHDAAVGRAEVRQLDPGAAARDLGLGAADARVGGPAG